MPAAILPFLVNVSTPELPYGGPGSMAPDRSWDVQALHLDLDLDPTHGEVRGQARFKVRAAGTSSPIFVLDQVALDIESVTLQDGTALPFEVRGDAVYIDLGERKQAELSVAYSASPQTGLHFRRPGNESPDTVLHLWSQGEGEDNRYWIPLPDAPNDRFAYSADFRVPEGLKVLSNGVGTQSSQGWHYEMEHDLVAYLIMVAAGDFEVLPIAGGVVPIEQWVLRGTDPESAKNAGHRLPQMFAHLEMRTGLAYPWRIYREVYVERFLYGGMENTTATVMSAERVLVPEELAATRTRAENIVAHELAHQWFGDTLTCETWSELWLNEGFATFMAADIVSELDGPETYALGVERWYRYSQTSGPLADRGWSPGEHSSPSNNVYSKGAAVLQMLRALLGEEVFWQGIQNYVAGNQMALVETADLRQAMEGAANANLRWFFDQWVHLPGAPKVKVSTRYDPSAEDLVVTLKQTPFKDGPQRTLFIDLEIGGEAGPRSERLWLSQGQSTLRLPLDQAPTYVAVDPQGGLLAELSYEQDLQAWVNQLSSAHPYARLSAIRGLEEFGDEGASMVLERLAIDPNEALIFREAAIESATTHSGSLAWISALSQSAEPRIQLAAVQALGERAEPEALDQLLGLSQMLPDVRVAWMKAIAAHDPARGRDIALRELQRDPGAPERISETAALYLLSSVGEPKDLKAVLRRIGPNTPAGPAHAALSTAIKLVIRHEPGKSRTQASAGFSEAARALLLSDALRTRQRAISALNQAGDESAVATLRALARSTTLPGTKASCEKAIQAIQARDTSAPVPTGNAWEARIEDLESELEEIEAALRKLEERS
ncbi:MAG: aminopeptidase N [Cognaticolwellia sp.]|jgi:aminopeptidase N